MRRVRLLRIALILLLAGAAGGAEAATFTVNSANDVSDGTCDGTHCSLREAIAAASAAPGPIASSSTSCPPASPIPSPCDRQ